MVKKNKLFLKKFTNVLFNYESFNLLNENIRRFIKEKGGGKEIYNINNLENYFFQNFIIKNNSFFFLNSFKFNKVLEKNFISFNKEIYEYFNNKKKEEKDFKLWRILVKDYIKEKSVDLVIIKNLYNLFKRKSLKKKLKNIYKNVISKKFIHRFFLIHYYYNKRFHRRVDFIRKKELFFYKIHFYDLKANTFIKNIISLILKKLALKGNSSFISKIFLLIFKVLKKKKIYLYKFFKVIYSRLFFPISLFKKKIAGRTMLVPNPYNKNFIKKHLLISTQVLKNSIKQRNEVHFGVRFHFELMDIYYGKSCISLKKIAENFLLVKNNLINMRFLKRKKRRRRK